jgi:hypothetical protein
LKYNPNTQKKARQLKERLKTKNTITVALFAVNRKHISPSKEDKTSTNIDSNLS